MSDLSSNRAIFCRAFWLREKRDPQEWEITLGLALLAGELVIERLPAAEALRRVHYAANWTNLVKAGDLCKPTNP